MANYIYQNFTTNPTLVSPVAIIPRKKPTVIITNQRKGSKLSEYFPAPPLVLLPAFEFKFPHKCNAVLVKSKEKNTPSM